MSLSRKQARQRTANAVTLCAHPPHPLSTPPPPPQALTALTFLRLNNLNNWDTQHGEEAWDAALRPLTQVRCSCRWARGWPGTCGCALPPTCGPIASGAWLE